MRVLSRRCFGFVVGKFGVWASARAKCTRPSFEFAQFSPRTITRISREIRPATVWCVTSFFMFWLWGFTLRLFFFLRSKPSNSCRHYTSLLLIFGITPIAHSPTPSHPPNTKFCPSPRFGFVIWRRHTTRTKRHRRVRRILQPHPPYCFTFHKLKSQFVRYDCRWMIQSFSCVNSNFKISDFSFILFCTSTKTQACVRIIQNGIRQPVPAKKASATTSLLKSNYLFCVYCNL